MNSLLYRFRDENIITDDEDDYPNLEEDVVEEYFSSGLDQNMKNFASEKTSTIPPYYKRIQPDNVMSILKNGPISSTITVSPSIVTAENMKMRSSNQSFNMLTPNIPALVLPSIDNIRTSDGFLSGVSNNLISLASDSARKIFAQFFLAALQTGIITKSDALVMAREADIALQNMESQLDQKMKLLTIQGSTSSKSTQLNSLLEEKLQRIKSMQESLRNTNTLTADLTRSVTNNSVSRNIYELQKNQEMANQLQGQIYRHNNTEDPDRLLKTILRMQEQTKQVLMQFVENIRRSDVRTHDVALENLIVAFENAIDSRVKDILNQALQ